LRRKILSGGGPGGWGEENFRISGDKSVSFSFLLAIILTEKYSFLLVDYDHEAASLAARRDGTHPVNKKGSRSYP
jgi:hypothetical protein